MMLVLMEVIYCSPETGGRGKGVIMYAGNLGLCFVVWLLQYMPLFPGQRHGASLSTTAFVHVCLCKKARLCECCTLLGLMYLCLVHSCGMREANYRGMRACVRACRLLHSLIEYCLNTWSLALNKFLYVCLCLYIPQCCVR